MRSFTQRSGGVAAGAVLLGLIAGCASPGTPRAPSLRLPTRVTALSAERHGAAVVLRFATPDHTTDNRPLTDPVMASLCRAVADGPCRPTSSFPGKIKIAGPVEWTDTLPTELASGAPQRLTYRVELFNPGGRSSGPSDAAFAAAGDAPMPVEGFRAEGSHAGVVLHWTPETHASGEILVKREAVNAPPPPPHKTAAPAKRVSVPKSAGTHKHHAAAPTASVTHAGSAKDESTVWLQAADGVADIDPGGMVDSSARADEPYRYTAVRSRSVTLDSHKLEMRSEPSAPIAFTLEDVYPPAIPQGLQVAGFPVEGANTLAADLVWQPNTEPDLAGYNVYRQALAGGPPTKLNAKLVVLPAFHDAAVTRGVGYRYTVTAVDAKGNESAASVAADLAPTP